MPDDKNQNGPARSLDGVLNDLHDVLSNLGGPEKTDATPSAPPSEPPVEKASAPAGSLEELFSFEVIRPEDNVATPAETPEPTPLLEPIHPAIADDVHEQALPLPPLPQPLPPSPDSCALLERAEDPALPPPPVSDAPTASWIRPDAGTDVFAEDNGLPAQDLAPAPPVPAPQVEEESPFAALIPGTQESRTSAVDPEPDPFELETEKRPEGLIQIACLFPEGEEKKGQAFVNKLKESGARMKRPLTIQPVFLHTWSPSAVDVAAWATSAALSGADAMFILAPKSSAALFGKLAVESARAGTSGRMIPTEILQSPALYADVLVDLARRANGTR